MASTDPTITGVLDLGNLGASGVPTVVTGQTSETIGKTVTIPANTIQGGDVLEIKYFWTVTNNANVKRYKINLNDGLGGVAILSINAANTTQLQRESFLGWNSDGLTVRAFNVSVASGTATTTVGFLSDSVDVTNDIDVEFRFELSDVGDTMILESYSITLKRAK